MTASGKAAAGTEAAALALHRFGFGPIGDQITAIAGDPRGAVLADLDRPGAGRLPVDLPSGAQAARAVFDFRAEKNAEQKLSQRALKEAEAGGAAATMDAGNAAPPRHRPRPL